MHVLLIAAISADGFISPLDKQADKSTAWTTKEDRDFFVARTKQAKYMLMGSTTYATIGRPLPERTTIVMTSNPEKIEGSLPLTRENLNPNHSLYTTSLSPAEIIDLLKQAGVQELTVCGGSSVYTQCLQAGIIHTLYLSLEPVLFGQGIPLLNQPLHQNLNLVDCKHLSQHTLLLEYQIKVS